MNYERVYSEFIADRRRREALLKVFDKHHIIPRCLGGGDEPENILRLSPSDHLFAHVLLARIHGGVLIQAAVRMSGMQKYNGGRRSRERYRHLRERNRLRLLGKPALPQTLKALRLANLGNKHFEGRQHTDGAKSKISEGLRVSLRRPETVALKRATALRQWSDPDMRAKMIKTGRPVSEATRAKLRAAATKELQQ